MKISKNWILVIGAVLALASCRKSADPSGSRVKFRPFDPNAKNIALIVGAPNDLEGVPKDIKEVSKLIRESGFGYAVVTVPVADVNMVMSKAREIGSSLSANSTVLFYFSGHGSEEGYLFAQGLGTFRLSSLAKEIGKGYGKGQFKRFVAVMDSCFSGQNVDGGEAMFLNQPAPESKLAEMNSSMIGNAASDMKPKADPNLPFEQALIVSAAQRYQTSLDAGPSIGGAFTYAWRKVMSQNLGKGNATLGQVLEGTRAQTRRDTGNAHTPAWKALPESMLQERLSDSGSSLNEIFIAIGEGDKAMIFASIPNSLSPSAVELCKGDKVACSAGSAPKLMTFSSSPDLKIDGRVIYRGDATYQAFNGDILTAIVRDGNGAAVMTSTIKLTQK
jgi:Caspase domain